MPSANLDRPLVLLRTPVDRPMVVEDAASGVRAARAAGVGTVVGVGERALETDAVVVDDLRGVTWTVSGLRIPRARILRAGVTAC